MTCTVAITCLIGMTVVRIGATAQPLLMTLIQLLQRAPKDLLREKVAKRQPRVRLKPRLREKRRLTPAKQSQPKVPSR